MILHTVITENVFFEEEKNVRLNLKDFFAILFGILHFIQCVRTYLCTARAKKNKYSAKQLSFTSAKIKK